MLKNQELPISVVYFKGILCPHSEDGEIIVSKHVGAMKKL
jgi:hypothetical protein